LTRCFHDPSIKVSSFTGVIFFEVKQAWDINFLFVSKARYQSFVIQVKIFVLVLFRSLSSWAQP